MLQTTEVKEESTLVSRKVKLKSGQTETATTHCKSCCEKVSELELRVKKLNSFDGRLLKVEKSLAQNVKDFLVLNDFIKSRAKETAKVEKRLTSVENLRERTDELGSSALQATHAALDAATAAQQVAIDRDFQSVKLENKILGLKDQMKRIDSTLGRLKNRIGIAENRLNKRYKFTDYE